MRHNSYYHFLAISLLSLLLGMPSMKAEAQVRAGRNSIAIRNAAFFTTPEARRIGDQVLLYQRVTGGWPKNIDMARPLSDEERQQVLADKQRRDDSTTDNNATVLQMDYLAQLYHATADETYRQAFLRAVDYLLSGQYANGGWPQFWPEMQGYQQHITYNDNAMVRTLTLLRDIADGNDLYQGLVTSKKTVKRMKKAFKKGIDCILKTQIITDGKPTVWCQQHDRETLLPAKARSYELPSYCSQESAAIVKLLMSLDKPSKRVRAAVDGAMQWFEANKIEGYRLLRTADPDNPLNRDTKLVPDDNATMPLWARFYDLDNCQPYVCDRDGIPQKRLEDIGLERRNNYSWYNSAPSELYPIYENWKNKK